MVFTSDHGESFGDHGVEDHGSSLYQSQVHIPLVFWARDLPSSWRNTPVGLADVAPTILDLVHAPPLPGAQGTSVRPLASSQRASHPAVPSARERFVWQPRDAPIYAWTTPDGLKRVRQQGRYAHTFDLTSSPCEAETTRWPGKSLETALDRWLADQHEARAQVTAEHPTRRGALRSDDVRMLEAMGYLEPTDDEP